MGRTPKRRDLVDATFGQHLALAVAARLARTQLVPDPLNSYDIQHIRESVDAIANALVRVTPLYVKGAERGELRQLTEAEVEGASVRNGADNLVLKDGRIISAVCVKRADLRQAIAVLKALGVPELKSATRQKKEDVPAGPPPNRMAELGARLSEVEDLLRLPLLPEQVARANRLVVEIARSAPHGRISNLAMRLMSAIHETRNGGDGQSIRLMVARLRSGIEDAAKSKN